mgnify:CR=1 FL=1
MAVDIGSEYHAARSRRVRWRGLALEERSGRRADLDVAHATKVVLLPRHELMMAWLASGEFTPRTLLGPDGLHMTDASYRCLALRIADLFARPTRIGTVQRP